MQAIIDERTLYVLFVLFIICQFVLYECLCGAYGLKINGTFFLGGREGVESSWSSFQGAVFQNAVLFGEILQGGGSFTRTISMVWLWYNHPHILQLHDAALKVFIFRFKYISFFKSHTSISNARLELAKK